ncbi:MAG: tRNA uridine-5-carboxymethylaminomethyl(34) synthesis GTPase MnmE [Legionellales bacterium]|nr:tRNA uridine-5-carboxymethylaminomethyl(34) synthesis GTPase MnmE [Legionellales bacterium]
MTKLAKSSRLNDRTMETIVAIATPPGQGGVGIIRLSGLTSFSIGQQLTRKEIITPRTVHHGSFYENNGELIDQGLLLYFKAPHSFTGEDIVELHSHGSPIVQDILLTTCVQLGARLARPGEFSERAFLNDKIDLVEAEAIADLIQASSRTAARMALRSLQGDFSKRIHALNEHLIQLRLYVEAAIDFPEEEIDFLSDGHVFSKLQQILSDLSQIRAEAGQGALLREGISVVIAGRPNAGKSTLINAMAKRDVAIVTPVPGTTRDVMREHILLDDLPVHIIDTAGLRESTDDIEKEGIKRAWDEVRRADCLLMVVDVCHAEDGNLLYEEIQAQIPPHVPILRVFNKIDQKNKPSESLESTLYLSALTGEGMPLLKEKIKQLVGYQPTEGQFLARRRHLEALDESKRLLTVGMHQLTEHRAGELLAEDLRLAHKVLCDITGEFSSDDLLGRIFSSFCIGK